MFFRGLIDAILMRTQQAIASGDSYGYLIPEHFDQIFTAHGVIMIFFMAMPLMFGLINAITSFTNWCKRRRFSFLKFTKAFGYLFAGALLINISLLIGDFSHCGWLAYPPFSGIRV